MEFLDGKAGGTAGESGRALGAADGDGPHAARPGPNGILTTHWSTFPHSTVVGPNGAPPVVLSSPEPHTML